MARTLEFYFDYGSPNAHFAWHRIPPILARTGAQLAYKIMLLGGVFKLTGNESPTNIKLKNPNQHRDMARFANKYKIPFQRNPHFPVNTLSLMRGAVVAEQNSLLEPYNKAMFQAMWVDCLPMGAPEIYSETLTNAGLDAEMFAEGIKDPAIKEKLLGYTAQAAERGVFGAPTFFVGDEMFFGQDRLDFVEEALMGKSYLTPDKG